MVKLMKKYEQFSKEELQNFCNESASFRDLARKIGYRPDSGSTNITLKEMILKYNLDTSWFTGQSHQKNLGKIRVPIEEYLSNRKKITSYKLRNRLLQEGIFEYKCCSCGLVEWLGQPIPLELHHKDGDKNNNSLENLELRCPNCHYFTETYKTKNIKREHLDLEKAK